MHEDLTVLENLMVSTTIKAEGGGGGTENCRWPMCISVYGMEEAVRGQGIHFPIQTYAPHPSPSSGHQHIHTPICINHVHTPMFILPTPGQRVRASRHNTPPPPTHPIFPHFQVSAYMRLAQKTTGEECRALADAVIDLLGISHVCNSEVRGEMGPCKPTNCVIFTVNDVRRDRQEGS